MKIQSRNAVGTNKALTGIKGFDEISEGGLPRGRTTLVMTLATKCVEHWDETRRTTWVDHSETALRDSLVRSYNRFGTIDVLQIHKTTAEVLRNPGLWRVLDAARARGESQIGVSVSDIEAGRLACEIDAIDLIQIPYNRRFQALEPPFRLSIECDKKVWTNGPFAMGAMIHEDGIRAVDACRFVLEQPFVGAILTGTVSPEHLREDWEAFRQAQNQDA